jgi:hypothetical protein
MGNRDFADNAGYTLRYQVLPVTIAADLQTPFGRVPHTGIVVGVLYIAVAAIVGAASPNSRTFSLINRGVGGVGAVVIATMPCINAGSSCATLIPMSIPLNVTVASRRVIAGEVISWTSIAVTGAGGLVDTGGTVEVLISPYPD